jgi:hypothetical protein
MKRAWVARAFLVFVGIALVVGLITLAYYVVVGAMASALSLLPWLLIMGFWIGLLRWWVPRASATAFRKVNRGLIRFSMDDHEIENGSETVSTKLKWETIERAVETPEVVLLFYTGNCALYLPKRAVPGEDLPGIRATIRAKVGPRAKLGE